MMPSDDSYFDQIIVGWSLETLMFVYLEATAASLVEEFRAMADYKLVYFESESTRIDGEV